MPLLSNGNGQSHGKGKGKTHPKVDEDEASADEAERRIDPKRGTAHTFKELCGFYRGQRTLKEVKEYWETECRLLYRGGSKPAKAQPPPPSDNAVPMRGSSADTPSKGTPSGYLEARHGTWKGERSLHSERVQPSMSSDQGVRGSMHEGMERRIDPEDGVEYTFEGLVAWYVGHFTRRQIQEYWDLCCEPVTVGAKGKRGKTGAKPMSSAAEPVPMGAKGSKNVGKPMSIAAKGIGAKGNKNASKGTLSSNAEAVNDDIPEWVVPNRREKRTDPSDGCDYTFEEIASFYGATLGRRGLQAYWMNACLPQHSGKGKGTGSANAKGAQDRERHLRRSPTHEAENDVDERPRFYLMYFTSTQDMAKAMTKDGWYTEDADTKRRKSILVPGGERVYAPSADDNTTPPLPMALCSKAKELEDLVKGRRLIGGQQEFPGFVFVFLPSGENLLSLLLDALGVKDHMKKEATLEITKWNHDFTDQQDGNVTSELSQATSLLTTFGTTYEMSFSDAVACAPMLYFSQNRTRPYPILGVVHTRLQTPGRRYRHRPYSQRSF